MLCTRNITSKRSMGSAVFPYSFFSLVCRVLYSFSNTSCDKGTTELALFLRKGIRRGTGRTYEIVSAEYTSRLRFQKRLEHILQPSPTIRTPHHTPESCDSASSKSSVQRSLPPLWFLPSWIAAQLRSSCRSPASSPACFPHKT